MASFISKVVVETLFAAWFSISYLGLVYDTVSWPLRANVMFSIATSFTTIVMGLTSQVAFLMRCWSDGRFRFDWEVQRMALGYIFTLVMMVWILIRLAGVFACPSHVFNLTSCS